MSKREMLFFYEGFQFLCSAERVVRGKYRPVLVRQFPWPSEERVPLLSDSETCRTEAQALQQAKVLAMKWVHARSTHAPVLVS